MSIDFIEQICVVENIVISSGILGMIAADYLLGRSLILPHGLNEASPNGRRFPNKD